MVIIASLLLFNLEYRGGKELIMVKFVLLSLMLCNLLPYKLFSEQLTMKLDEINL